jgi:hypothetical protein
MASDRVQGWPSLSRKNPASTGTVTQATTGLSFSRSPKDSFANEWLTDNLAVIYRDGY